MEVKFEVNNTTIIIRNGKLWLAIFNGKDLFKQIIVSEVIDNVKAVAKLFLDVDELPNIDVEKCDEMTISVHGFTAYYLEIVDENGEEKRYLIKGRRGE